MRAGVLLLLLVALGCNPWAFAQKPAKPQPPSQAAGDALRQAQAAAQRAEEAARTAVAARVAAEKRQDETLKKLDTQSSEMMGRANFLQTISSYMTGLVSFFVMAVGILGGIVAFRTDRSLKQSLEKLRQGEVTANQAAAKIVEMKEGIEKHQLFVNNLQLQVTAALKDIELKLEVALTPGTGLIGVPLASEVPQRSYDDDALIVFADRLRMDDLQPERRATFLVKVSNYWRRWKGYDRAIERARRAIELDASSPAAHKALGRAIWNKVAEDLAATQPPISSGQATLLGEAETELKAAQGLLTQGNAVDEEIPFDLGTICRFKGDIPGAIRQYQSGAQLSKVLAASAGRAQDWDFDYAVACLYAKTGQYHDALDQLKQVIGKTESWSQDRRRVEPRDYRDWMQSDPDFAAMRTDTRWEPELKKL
jgi:tetratricopeptide (TPR) repeat protein